MSVVIGIAFGNTSSSIAVANPDGKVDVIANPDGDRSIPSALAYIGSDEYHGAQALAHLVRTPKNTIINFRDFIGLPFEKIDATVCERAAHAIDVDGKVAYKISKSEDDVEVITVEEATKRHLKQIKLAAEDYIGKSIEGVVITVPTNFTQEQRDTLTKISSEAGLKVLQLINEPSAALLAYLSADETRLSQDKLYVVADFGGVRSDAAVIAVRGGILTILATAHNFELGGDKLDDVLAEFFAKEFQKKYKSNARSNARSLAKLKSECIVTKKTLSNVNTSTISIDSLADGFDFHSTVNRLRYELVARDVLSQMTGFIESVVKKAGLDNLDIDEVLLVGGTSHTPKLASNVQFIFPESTIIVSPSTDSKAIDPSELVCRGAALQASMIESFDEEEVKQSLEPVIVNVQHIQKPIGLAGADGSFLEILAAETSYPTRKSVKVAAPAGDALIQVYEGNRTIKETTIEPEVHSDDSEDESDEEPEIKREVVYIPGEKLAELAVKDVAKDSEVEITIDINKDGVLQVSARDVNGSSAIKGHVSQSS